MFPQDKDGGHENRSKHRGCSRVLIRRRPAGGCCCWWSWQALCDTDDRPLNPLGFVLRLTGSDRPLMWPLLLLLCHLKHKQRSEPIQTLQLQISDCSMKNAGVSDFGSIKGNNQIFSSSILFLQDFAMPWLHHIPQVQPNLAQKCCPITAALVKSSHCEQVPPSNCLHQSSLKTQA